MRLSSRLKQLKPHFTWGCPDAPPAMISGGLELSCSHTDTQNYLRWPQVLTDFQKWSHIADSTLPKGFVSAETSTEITKAFTSLDGSISTEYTKQILIDL